MKLRLITLVMILSGLLGASSTAVAQTTTTRLVVSPTGPFTTIQAALDTAVPGDTIEVHSGVYDGPLVVDKSVQIEGVDWPVIDGRNQGTVVTLTAPDSAFRGFVVTGSGIESDRDHAGITLEAPRIVVENNRLENVLFGVFVAQADDSIVRGNDITSKPEYEHGRKGDGIRLWYSQRVLVADNHIYNSRDLVLWYSSDVILRNNVVEDGRYGVHLMYCDGALIEDNQFLNNSVGIYTMYTNHVTVQRNLLRGHRGPSGYGLGFKDTDHIQVLNNVMVNNGAGIFLDGTPSTRPSPVVSQAVYSKRISSPTTMSASFCSQRYVATSSPATPFGKTPSRFPFRAAARWAATNGKVIPGAITPVSMVTVMVWAMCLINPNASLKG